MGKVNIQKMEIIFREEDGEPQEEVDEATQREEQLSRWRNMTIQAANSAQLMLPIQVPFFVFFGDFIHARIERV